MNLQQLEYILAIDRYRNFTRAAEACFVTQATLSAMVKKLEEELGVVIFDRRSSPIMPTEIGKELLIEAREVLAHTTLLTEKAKSSSGKVEGHLRLAVIPTIANSFLPRILQPLLATYPGLSLEITEYTTSNIIRQLREGTIDLGLLSTPVEAPDMEHRLLYYESLMVYGDIDKQKRYVLPEEIRNHKIWLLEEGHCLRTQFMNLCSLREGDSRFQNLKFEASSFETLLNMIDQFGGLTLIPELLYLDLPAERKSRVSFFEAPLPVREVSLMYYRPYAKRCLIDAVEKFVITTMNPLLISRDIDKEELSITAI